MRIGGNDIRRDITVARIVVLLWVAMMYSVTGCESGAGPGYKVKEFDYEQSHIRAIQKTRDRLDAADSFQDFQDVYGFGSGYADWVNWREEVNYRQREWFLRENRDLDPPIHEIIKAQKVRIGMTADQCRASWGIPLKVNRTTSATGIYEQWVYGHSHPWLTPTDYLYFGNGILTSMQSVR